MSFIQIRETQIMSEQAQDKQQNNINLIRQKLQEIETTLNQINNRLTKLERPSLNNQIDQDQVQRSGRQFFDLKDPEPRTIDPFGRPTKG